MIRTDPGGDSTLILYEDEGRLWLQHEFSPPGADDAPAPVALHEHPQQSGPQPVSGPIGVFVVTLRGLVHAVLAGEALTGVDSVVLTFTPRDPQRMAEYEAWEQQYRVVYANGRRVWMSHAFPYYAGMSLTVTWMQGPDAISDDQVRLGESGVSYVR